MPLITNANEEGIEVEVNPVGQMSVDVSSTGTNPPIVAEIDNIITAEEVPVIDTASKFTATNVEGVLAELDDKILEAGQVDDVKNGDGVSLVTNKIATVTPQNIGAYTKPNSGIPKTDLASDVQTSLGKADSALQSESDPTVPSWAKQTNKPTYTKSEVGLGNVDNTADLDKPISTATQTALDNKVPNTRKVNNKALSEDITLSASDVGALPSNTTYVSSVNGDSGAVTGISKVSETGYSLELSMDSSTFVITATLKNKSGTALSTQTVDLPLESVVVSGSYDNVNKKVILTLKNGSTIEFSVADLVSGLQTEITPSNKLSVTLIDGLSAVATSGNYTDLTNKPTTLSSFTDDLGSSPVHTHSQYLTSHQDISGKENISNKVTTISSSSTDTQYPSAKCVYDNFVNKSGDEFIQGVKSFASRPLSARLPSAYQEVEYIEASGSQYIDTEYIFTQPNIKINQKYLKTESLNVNSFGVDRGNAPREMHGNIYANYVYFGNSSVLNISSTQSLNVVYDYTFEFSNDTATATINGNQFTHSGNNGWAGATKSDYLFATHSNEDTPTYLMYGRIYKHIMWDNGVCVRSFVPCYRKSDTEIGMYDLVNGVFYTNQGTGTFSKGADVVSGEFVVDSDLSTVATSGNYNDLSNKPTQLSQFTDNLGDSPIHTHSQYITQHQSLKTINGNSILGSGDLVLYATDSDYTAYMEA